MPQSVRRRSPERLAEKKRGVERTLGLQNKTPPEKSGGVMLKAVTAASSRNYFIEEMEKICCGQAGTAGLLKVIPKMTSCDGSVEKASIVPVLTLAAVNPGHGQVMDPALKRSAGESGGWLVSAAYVPVSAPREAHEPDWHRFVGFAERAISGVGLEEKVH